MGIREVISVLRDVPVLLALKKGMKPRPWMKRVVSAR